MAKGKIGTTIEPIENGRTYTKNMFTPLVGGRYARGFHEVYHSGLEDREEKMRRLYEEAMADDSLDEKQKHLIKACYVGFNEAICRNAISMPIIAFVSTKKPVLSKAIRTMRKKGNRVVKSNRLKRTVNDLYDAVEKTGFLFEVAYLPSLIKAFEVQFERDEKRIYDEESGLTFEALVMAALSAFVRASGPRSYANLWYVSYFMQNLSLLAYAPLESYQSIPGLKEQGINLMKTIRSIQYLELKRAGLVPELKEVRESDGEETEQPDPAETNSRNGQGSMSEDEV